MRISDWSSDVCSSDLIALLDGGERTASVTATSAGSALQLGRNALKDFAASHPEFTWSLMQQLARRLRTAHQTIESDRAYASGPRLARYLKRPIRKDVEASPRVELSQTELERKSVRAGKSV